MDKDIPCEKHSKKEKRKLDKARRTTWGSLNPVTRSPQNSKAYNRKKMQNRKKRPDRFCIFFLLFRNISPCNAV